jgi:ammonia channel protein AmtB
LDSKRWSCRTKWRAYALTGTYAFVVTFLILRGISRFTPVRVAADIERDGLDAALHGEAAYQPLLVPAARVFGAGGADGERDPVVVD